MRMNQRCRYIRFRKSTHYWREARETQGCHLHSRPKGNQSTLETEDKGLEGVSSKRENETDRLLEIFAHIEKNFRVLLGSLDLQLIGEVRQLLMPAKTKV